MKALIHAVTRFVHTGPPRQVADRIVSKTVIDLVRQHTEVTREHLTPELALHLITPRCRLWTASAQDDIPFCDPYWAFYWPGGQAMARYLLDNPSVVTQRTVLDVGSGSGACAIAAAKSRAKKVIANDIDPVAGIAISLNAALNDVELDVSTEDLIGSCCKAWDCVILGDMFYDSEMATKLFTWMDRLRNMNKTVLFGDPGRHGFSEAKQLKMACLAEYDLPEYAIIENRGFTTAKVWTLT